MFDKYELIFSQPSKLADETIPKTAIPPELEKLLKSGVKRIVLDPEKNLDILKPITLLGVEPISDAEESKSTFAKTRAMGTQTPVVAVGPEIGVEPCVRITIGFIWPCGTLRIGGCS